jgi:type IV pilus assembly protein PilE
MQHLAHQSSQSRPTGFTLVELMIAVAIVGILAVLAFPQYSQYMIRAHHASGEQFLMDVAQRQEQYFLDGHAYAPDLATLGITPPPDVANYYTVDAFVIGTNPPGYQMSITPVAGGIMDGNGTLVITNVTASVSTQ